MAILAGVVDAAAFHFDGDDVEWGVVMEAAGLGIEVQAEDFGGEWGHGIGRGSREKNSKMSEAGKGGTPG
ncbi:MAG TPA: hypothetical protein VKH63_18220 [Candidatus Acidoferrum sp.]|nr:hypothetical protein [Candidatus Acidoferrum sp.]